MKNQLLVLIGFLIILFSGCEPEEEQISTTTGLPLLFSNDTVIFDTLLSSRQSITKRLRIFNPNERAVKISDIRLGKGDGSDYSMIVNGKFGNSIQDEVLFGGDSLLILIDITVDPQDRNLPYLVKDSIIVEWNTDRVHVKLVAWGQDARFINGETICDEVWTADRPYVIYNFALVDSLCQLTIEPGARIYLDNGASFFIQGNMQVNGDSGNHVIFRNTRFDERYQEAPGQWGGIFFLEGSTGNEIHYAEIENGEIGLRIGTPDDDDDFDVSIYNSIIRHMSGAGILAFTSDIYAVNTLIHNAGSFLIGNFAGGTYRYEHCTFTNAPSFFINEDPVVQFSDNVVLSEDEVLVGDLSVTMLNSIIWGQGSDQLFINEGGGAVVTTDIRSNIIRSNQDWPENVTSNEPAFPGFRDPFTFDYQLDSLSFAIDKGIDLGIEDDLRGYLRDSNPDIGAYEKTNR